MGIWDKLFNRTTFWKKEIKNSFDKKSSSSIILFFGDKQYTVENFSLEFKQDMDNNGDVDSRVYGGIITITISDVPDERMNWWIVDSFHKYDGEFRFFKNEETITEGAQLFIFFKEAYCTDYKKVINPKDGVLTTLTIHPRVVKVGNEEFENAWRNK